MKIKITITNNQIKTLLKFDLIVQLLIGALSLSLLLFPIDGYYTFIGIYFILGSWQIFSFLIHLKRRLKKLDLIQSYAKVIASLFVLGLLCLLINYSINFGFLSFFLIFYHLIMLFLGPALAAWYIIITIRDLTDLKKYNY